MMRKVLLSLVVVVALFSAVSVRAQSPNNKSVYFTFSQPVSLPQVTLPPGRYLFELAGSNTNRFIVLVYSGDRSKLHATLMTIPNQRTQASDTPEVRFMEAAASAPHPIKTWWYPGEKTGWEFIYPREQAMVLAKTARQPVLTTSRNTTSEEMKTADLARIDQSGQTVPVAPTGDMAITSMSGDFERGEVNSTASSTRPGGVAAAIPGSDQAMPSRAEQDVRASRATGQSATAAGDRRELPTTASQTPLVALMGILALSLAALLRGRRYFSA